MDIRFTKEGIPVICHDDNTSKLFGSTREIAELTIGPAGESKRRCYSPLGSLGHPRRDRPFSPDGEAGLGYGGSPQGWLGRFYR